MSAPILNEQTKSKLPGRHRPSWVRLDRVLVVAEHGIRREGAILERDRFDAVAAELRRSYGWR